MSTPMRTALARAPASEQILRFDRYAWAEALPRFGGAWSELIEAAALNPSLGPEWVDLSLRAHGADAGAAVWVGTHNDRTAAVVPVFERRLPLYGIHLRALEIASNLTGYHTGLIAPGCEDDVAKWLLDSGSKWDVLVVRSAVSPGPTLDALRAAVAERGLYHVELSGHRSPYLPVERSWTDFLAAKSSNFRYNLQRKKKKFLKAPGARIEWVAKDRNLDELLAQVLEIEAASWKAEQGVAISQNPAESRYYRNLLQLLVDKGALEMNVLWLGEEPVAYTLCCRSGGWMGLLKTSFKSQHGSTAAGTCSLNETVARAFELGVTEYDFLGGEDSYKLEWSPSVRQHVDVMIFGRTLRGRAVAAIAALRRSVRRSLRRDRPASVTVPAAAAPVAGPEPGGD
jgi:CelD/BcsL family acetyltransferase involved in cellulose biosynthesis